MNRYNKNDNEVIRTENSGNEQKCDLDDNPSIYQFWLGYENANFISSRLNYPIELFFILKLEHHFYALKWLGGILKVINELAWLKFYCTVLKTQMKG